MPKKSLLLIISSKFIKRCYSEYKVIMVRHGESEWNKLNLFCGWMDVNLTERGIDEAKKAGIALKKENYTFDIAFTSLLKRAHQTLDGILKEMSLNDLRIEKTWRLNERHYGGLTGLNKVKTVEKYGEKQVQIWRRSYDIPPPEMKDDNPYFKEVMENSLYINIPKDEFPNTESLKLTIARTMPYWDKQIVPEIKKRKHVIIVAHGNSLRGIVKTLDKISDKDITSLNLPTGIPFEYNLDNNMQPISPMKFLGDPETVKKAMDEVANQTKKK